GGAIGQAAAIRQLVLWADFLTAQFLGDDVLFTDDTDAPSDHPRMPPSLVRLSRDITIPRRFDAALGAETRQAARDLKLLLVAHDAATRTGRSRSPSTRR
ncbi:hypothetical protein CLAIMM_00001, partial [Cladophialophora immunda]